MYLAPLQSWIRAFRGTGHEPVPGFAALYDDAEERDRWRHRYLGIFERYAMTYGDRADVAVARCPGQMNVMGMHMDYGGMPSLRMAVSGTDLITVAGQSADGKDARVRMESVFDGEGSEVGASYEPFELDLEKAFPTENVGTHAALKNFAGKICRQREASTGSPFESGWGILPMGALIFLESHFRSRAVLKGFDAVVWSNLSPTGGLSSSSALVMSTAYAALGVSGLIPGRDIGLQTLVEGVGLSEWIRGTRGGTADHMGMVAGGRGELACIGAMPVCELSRASLPSEYEAIAFDSGVPRVYDEAVKEETAMAYPLAAFLVREILLKSFAERADWPSMAADVRDRLRLVRDIRTDTLGLSQRHICEILKSIPQVTTLRQLRGMAVESGSGTAYEAMRRAEIDGRFTAIDDDYPLPLRRRITFALAEQDRVVAMVDSLNSGDVEKSLTLIRKSHAGERDEEVSDSMLDEIAESPVMRLSDLPGGYGRMTGAYDRVATTVNDFLIQFGGEATGAVQRLGAGWGGNIGGLVRRDFLKSRGATELEETLMADFGLETPLADSVVRPGAGACLIHAPLQR